MQITIISPRQCTITTDLGVYLQSYDSIVAFKPNSLGVNPILYKKWDYSQTTKRHLRKFFGETSLKESILKGKYYISEEDKKL